MQNKTPACYRCQKLDLIVLRNRENNRHFGCTPGSTLTLLAAINESMFQSAMHV